MNPGEGSAALIPAHGVPLPRGVVAGHIDRGTITTSGGQNMNSIDVNKARKAELVEWLTAQGWEQSGKVTVAELRDAVRDMSDIEPPAKAVGEMDRDALLVAAKAEHAEAKAAKKAKRKLPATPHLDELKRRQDNGTTRAKKNGKAPRPKPCVRYARDGKPMPDSQNSLSSVAYQCTRGVDGDAPRIPSKALRVMLVDAGIESPETTAWEHTLSNGVVVSATVEA